MFEKFNNVEDHKILVIGDIILDKYIYGQSTRISPEAPVPVVLSEKVSWILGGAANVAANLKSLGVNVSLIGCVGTDAHGDNALELIKSELSGISGIYRTKRKTTTKTRIVAKGQQMLRIDEEDISDITNQEQALIYSQIEKSIVEQKITGVILQDYNKGLLTETLIEKIISVVDKYNIPLFVDPKYKNFWKYQDATIFKPNLSEIKKANNFTDKVLTDDLFLNSAKKLNCEILMCTLAEEGICCVTDGNIVKTPTQKIDVIDVSGAGDSALSIIVLTYLLGYDIKQISLLANLCGKIVCMKSGVSTITIKELYDAYHSAHKDNAT